MKKIMVIAMLFCILIVSISAFGQRVSKPFESTRSFEFNPGKTVAAPADTQTGWFKMEHIYNYGKITGYIYVEITNVDTNAAGEYPDTTKDSMSYTMYTISAADANIKKAIAFDSLIAQAAQDTLWFTIPADSAILDAVYFNFETVIGDSTHNITDDGLGVTYQITVYMKQF